MLLDTFSLQPLCKVLHFLDVGYCPAATEIPYCASPAQREVLNLYVDRGSKAMMDLKGHLRAARGQGE